MGRLSLSDVIRTLQDAGMAVERGFPAGKLTNITGPVCAVNLLKANQREQTLTAQVTVLSPAELGAGACEDAALKAAQVLSDLDYKCTTQACQLDGRTGLFMAKVTAGFSTNLPRFLLGESELCYVESFTYWRELEGNATDLEEMPWNIRLEEFFPSMADESEDVPAPFTLTHVTHQGVHTFSDCCWTSCKRIWSSEGVRQIRIGTSEYMELS